MGCGRFTQKMRSADVLLGTNIISNVTWPTPSEALLDWPAKQADKDLCISSLTIAEIRRGVLEKPAGKRRRALEKWFPRVTSSRAAVIPLKVYRPSPATT
jgi:predicted nucleic acid-binding protein